MDKVKIYGVLFLLAGIAFLVACFLGKTTLYFPPAAVFLVLGLRNLKK